MKPIITKTESGAVLNDGIGNKLEFRSLEEAEKHLEKLAEIHGQNCPNCGFEKSCPACVVREKRKSAKANLTPSGACTVTQLRGPVPWEKKQAKIYCCGIKTWRYLKDDNTLIEFKGPGAKQEAQRFFKRDQFKCMT